MDSVIYLQHLSVSFIWLSWFFLQWWVLSILKRDDGKPTRPTRSVHFVVLPLIFVSWGSSPVVLTLWIYGFLVF